MNFMPLLLALIGALTGLTPGAARAPVSAAWIAQPAVARVAVRRAEQRQHQPVVAVDHRAALLVAVPVTRFAFDTLPVFGSRRRE